ncbi:ATP-binding protein (AAA domain) [Arcobacter acticola]|jgi:midasin (ATPase involved in ribosome maturation)|uniref:ATP-binding protein (AAA domain) n=1 Tax=Arcobacter acticola TaxID=1849015 RepID=A0A6M8EUJ5_9BACT|nr:MoxR family ATPase [Arcobacter acticola]QKE28185.1 ATP-binding protein (AAA domain) [Arcobacter acticola]
MKASILKKSLISMIDSKIPVFVWGNPGVGKSSIIKQIANDKNMEFIDLRLSLLDPTDLRGIPFFDSANKSAIWAKPEFLPNSNSQAFGILFLDEINSAPPTVQAAAYQLILDRKIGEYTLPMNYAIVAAGNYESDRGVTYRMPTPLANRFVHLDFELDFEEWKSWAYESKIDTRIISFLSYKPQNLFTFDAKAKEKSFATPRSWSFVNDILNSNLQIEFLKDVISGAVGKDSSDEFMNFCKVIDKLPNIQEILEAINTEVPTNNSVLYALCTGIVYALKENSSIEKVTNILNYSLNLPNEFSVMLIRDLQKEGVEIESSVSWKSWVNANKFLIG